MIQGLIVETEHIILPHGTDRMVLGDRTSGQAIIVAQREDGVWTISSPWTEAEAVTAEDRDSAVTAMEEMDLAVSPNSGYATFEPDVRVGDAVIPLRELP